MREPCPDYMTSVDVKGGFRNETRGQQSQYEMNREENLLEPDLTVSARTASPEYENFQIV